MDVIGHGKSELIGRGVDLHAIKGFLLSLAFSSGLIMRFIMEHNFKVGSILGSTNYHHPDLYITQRIKAKSPHFDHYDDDALALSLAFGFFVEISSNYYCSSRPSPKLPYNYTVITEKHCLSLRESMF